MLEAIKSYKMKKIWIYGALAFGCQLQAQTLAAEQTAPYQAVVDFSANEKITKEFLKIVKEQAVNAKKINWDSITPALLNETRNAASSDALKKSFTAVLKLLKDGHSKIYHIQPKKEEANVMEAILKTTDSEAGLPPKHFLSQMIEGKYAYINVPPVVYENYEYVANMQKQLEALDRQQPKAWIIDLTENTGGNVFTMILHFKNLLDQKNTFTYYTADGKAKPETGEVTWKKGEVSETAKFIKGAKLDQVKPVVFKNSKIPIILLTSQMTASSGEFFAAYFKGQKNVTLVGQKTFGLTSGNQPFNLSKDLMLNLSTSVLKDRTGKIYDIGEGIVPDVTINPEFGTYTTYEQLIAEITKNKQQYIDAAVLQLKKKE